MNKQELIDAIKPLLPEALTLNETATNAQLEATLTVLKSPELLEKEIANSTTLKEQLEASKGGNSEEIEKLQAEVVELNQKLAVAEKLTDGKSALVVKVDGKDYQVKSGTALPQGTYSAKAIAENQEVIVVKDGEKETEHKIADYLVSIGSGVLKQL